MARLRLRRCGGAPTPPRRAWPRARRRCVRACVARLKYLIQRLLSALLSQQDDMRIVIFVNTQKECQELAHYLRYQKYEVSYLHGGLDSKQRKSALSYFVEEKSNILVATDVAARGLNMGDIEWVINFDTPAEKADYVHRVGRTGRGDGVKGLAINFVTSHDWDDYAGFANSLGITMPIFHIDGFEGDYKGPKKLKQSGKAAKTTKRKKPDAKTKAKAKAKK